MSDLPDILSGSGFSLYKTFKPGGQSKTFLIQKTSETYLLKIPKTIPLSKEQKFRFQREVEALKLMDGNGVPKIHSYDVEDEPFIVMEYIEGKTLSELVSGKPLPVKKALEILHKLLHTIKAAHALGLFHRDLKPDNIIINKAGEPVIIDFGICWFDTGSGFETPIDVELGNRFLRLPELSKGRDVTISVSDITFLVGILFFMVTAKSPNILMDENGHKPHQRIEVFKGSENKANKVCQYIFDKGFSYDIVTRFQTAVELQTFIHQMLDEDNLKPNSSMEDLTEFLDSDQSTRGEKSIELVFRAQEQFKKASREGIPPGLVCETSNLPGPFTSKNGREVLTNMKFHRKRYLAPLVHFSIRSTFDSDFKAVSTECIIEGQIVKTISHSISEETRILDDFQNLGNEIQSILADTLKKMLQNI